MAGNLVAGNVTTETIVAENIANAAGNPLPNLFHARDEKADATQGGSTTSSWSTRDLNTVLTNEISGASLATNEVTLPAGTYWIEGTNRGYGANSGSRARLYDVTGAAVLILFMQTYADSQSGDIQMRGRFTLSTESAVRIEHIVNSATATNGYGSHDSMTQGAEVYQDVCIWKVA